MSNRRKFWGWGREGEGPSGEQRRHIAAALAQHFGIDEAAVASPPRIEEIALREPRVVPPSGLAPICTSAPEERAGHTYGKSFRDVVRAFRREFENPPDAVALPRTEADVVALLEWCASAGVAAIPYGGGSSVVGGVEPPPGDAYRGSVSIDLRHFDRVLEIDRESRAAHIQAGILGPALEGRLRDSGLTLRHFPQSFEFSSLGGWIATRAGGHFATLYTHIDDFVESLRIVTPAGIFESRRLPGSGAGPSPDRIFIGSEGVLGIITEAWMRLQDRPRFRASCAVPFPDFTTGAAAVRAVGQSGLFPANCRLLDPGEARISGAGTGAEAVLLLAFESADHRLDAWIDRALECVADHGGRIPDGAVTTRTGTAGGREGAAGAWRRAFLDGPYLRDLLVAMGMITETFETAITWDRFNEFHARVMTAATHAVRKICRAGSVTCRFTHVYPDGAAPYYTVIAPSTLASQLEQWTEIKAAASEAILASGGTITHHHAVGRDHRRWYDRQRPEPFAKALVAAKAALDPRAILNPGVLIDPAAPASP